MQIDSIQWIIHAKDRARHIAQIRNGSLLLTQIRMDCDNSRRLSIYSRVLFWHAFHVVRCARLVLLPFSWFVRIFQRRTWMKWDAEGGNERLIWMEKRRTETSAKIQCFVIQNWNDFYQRRLQQRRTTNIQWGKLKSFLFERLSHTKTTKSRNSKYTRTSKITHNTNASQQRASTLMNGCTLYLCSMRKTPQI